MVTTTAQGAHIALQRGVADIKSAPDGHTSVAVKLVGQVCPAALSADVAPHSWVADVGLRRPSPQSRVDRTHQLKGELVLRKVNGVPRNV